MKILHCTCILSHLQQATQHGCLLSLLGGGIKELKKIKCTLRKKIFCNGPTRAAKASTFTLLYNSSWKFHHLESMAAPVRINPWQAVSPVHHIPNHTCRVTLFQPARWAAVLGRAYSLRHHCFQLSRRIDSLAPTLFSRNIQYTVALNETRPTVTGGVPTLSHCVFLLSV
jgi:hypothetical protein